MKCSYCGGLVTWRGPFSNLSHTECTQCGRQNCQEPEWPEVDEDANEDAADGVKGLGE